MEAKTATSRNIRKRRFPDHVVRRIEQLAARAYPPSQIERQLAAEGIAERPSVRTIWEIASRVRSAGAQEQWVWRDADPSEAALVLPVVAAVIAETEGRVHGVTRQAAEWIIRLRRAVPDIRPWTAYWVAIRYGVAVDMGLPTDDLDDFIAAYAGGPESAAALYSKLMQTVGRDG